MSKNIGQLQRNRRNKNPGQPQRNRRNKNPGQPQNITIASMKKDNRKLKLVVMVLIVTNINTYKCHIIYV